MKRRPSIPVRVQVAVALKQAVKVPCPLCGFHVDHTSERVLEHMVPRAWTESDGIEGLAWVHKACADKKTFGSGATVADGDLHKIAKVKRLAKARAEHEAIVAKLATRAPGKIKSRPFPKTQRGFR